MSRHADKVKDEDRKPYEEIETPGDLPKSSQMSSNYEEIDFSATGLQNLSISELEHLLSE